MYLRAGAEVDGVQTAAERRTSRRAPIDYRANVALLGLVATALAMQLFAWPFMLRQWGASALWVAVPLVVLTPTHWGLIHESIHGQLSPQRRLNEWLGRALAIAFVLPFDAVRFGHLMHHRFTREAHDRPDVHDGATHPVLARISYYAHLLGGLYLGELALPLVTFLPTSWVCRLVAHKLRSEEPVGQDIQRLFVGFAGNQERCMRMRRDWVLSVALHGCAFYLYGAWWPALAITMFLRGVWLSVADNLPHYDVTLDEQQRARNFRAPAIWRPVLMNHHLHRLHHQYPTLPWTALPALARVDTAASGAHVDAGYFRAALRQFRGFGKVR
ncbi:fatty acid desaturase family protein [Dyella nitratireducens]|uniref:Fatty acid desaturase n=1 Tax=Dyella nitratireducens TaxID=1849580 RepID=A0ABQ1GAF0_9GAMM|nr:fatty acid desaturase [Dyella nitratireducens]GGA39906.1 fatty acid desaturase [Dyella nitratireducens]GLQ40503.1 fatty acid desaturase [Dyella nitratireducens]